MSEKLQKVLARAGYGSRRQIENWIKLGRVNVDGRLATIGERVELTAKITLDGKPCRIATSKPDQPRVILYHKPVGEICTRSDPEERRTVFQSLPKIHRGRWVSVGRLDINTSGLLLFTDDGELANQLMHPSNVVEREYAVRILGELDHLSAQKLTQGVELDDGMARFEHVVESGGDGANRWYHVLVVEGRNRLVRRLFESQGFAVSRLTRVRYGSVMLPKSVRVGSCKELTEAEVSALRESAVSS